MLGVWQQLSFAGDNSRHWYELKESNLQESVYCMIFCVLACKIEWSPSVYIYITVQALVALLGTCDGTIGILHLGTLFPRRYMSIWRLASQASH